MQDNSASESVLSHVTGCGPKKQTPQRVCRASFPKFSETYSMYLFKERFHLNFKIKHFS